ncbi:MAG: TIGR02281 family clan AA aspartic protease [Candidatus Competibacterales bacterium]
MTKSHGTRSTGLVMVAAAAVGLLVLLTLFFQEVLERRFNPNRQPTQSLMADGVRQVVLKRNALGHYLASGTINGVSVDFLLDTGASDVSIPAHLGAALGLERGAPRQFVTANGVITAYSTVVDQLRLGNIVDHGVRASLNPHQRDDLILLGMSFMADLELIQRGGTLTLRQYPSP